MNTYDNYESNFSQPWWIQFLDDDNQGPHDSVNKVAEQAARLALNEQNLSSEPKVTSSWFEHEKLTGHILNEAAQRVVAETHRKGSIRV
jgi:hypothetical protein